MNKAIQKLRAGEIVVYPTDTLYGMLVRALDRRAVERLYRIRKRDSDKPFILLVSSLADVEKFCALSSADKKILAEIWPAKISVIVPCKGTKWRYLHRGTKSLAFRMPRSRKLQDIIKKTGPLAAPTANMQGEPPAETVREARAYFGDAVALYVSRGRKKGKPSTLVRLSDGKLGIVREGADVRRIKKLE
jgi:L-threonylcarbamoyladenylate synthase